MCHVIAILRLGSIDLSDKMVQFPFLLPVIIKLCRSQAVIVNGSAFSVGSSIAF